MTVNTARRPRRRTTGLAPEPLVAAPVGTLAIGEIGQTVFDCPTCSRPLALGARRCPGCRTRLVLGVPLSKASVLASAGLAIGLLAGSVGGFVVATARSVPIGTTAPIPAASAAVTFPSAVATTLPVASTAPALVPSVVPGPVIPPLARSALTQAVNLDTRLASSGTALAAALATSSFSASDVAEILRGISADSVYGGDLVDRLSTWPDAAPVSGDLATIYGSIHDTAAAGLVASVRDAAAYRATARATIALIGRITTADARARELLAANGVVMPGSASTP
jgi:hypothetical protein